jgi:hypothetical protein
MFVLGRPGPRPEPVQPGHPERRADEPLGVVTSASQFFRQIGATIGIAIFGTLFTNNLNDKLAASPLGQMIPNLDIGKLQEFAAASAGKAHGGAIAMPPQLKEIITTSITDVFFLGSSW